MIRLHLVRFTCSTQRFATSRDVCNTWSRGRQWVHRLQACSPSLRSHRSALARAATLGAMANQPPAPPAPSSAPAIANKPREEPAGMERQAQLLESFSEIPSISAAWGQDLPDGGLTLTVQTTQRNVAANGQRKSVATYAVPGAWDGSQPLQPSFPVELKDVLLLSVSPSGRRSLVARKDDKGLLLEVWVGGRLLNELAVPEAVHGPLYNDGWFGAGAEWSPDESRVAYVAEAPPEVKTPAWGNSSAGPEPAKDAAAPRTWRGVGEWGEDWGELNAGKRPPAVFVLELEGYRVQRVQGLPPGTSAGQPVWAPSGDALVCVVWEHQYPVLARRLGIVYCFNRPCALHAVPVPRVKAGLRATEEAGAATGPRSIALTPSLQSAFSPQFAPSAAGGAPDTLVFLSQDAACESGVHSGTVAMHSLPWAQSGDGESAARAAADAAVRTVVPVISNAADAEEQGFDKSFPGLYASRIPSGSITGSGIVLVTSQWRSSSAIIALDPRQPHVARVTPDDGSWALLCITAGWAVAARSDPGRPPELHLARLPADGSSAPWQWQRAAADHVAPYAAEVEAALAGITYEVLQVEPTTAPLGVPFEMIVMRGAGSEGPQPAVLSPHGGPHSAYATSFVMPLAFLAASGYTIVLVNFRGSTGFGEESIQSLPGRVGANDVADCIAALDAAVAKGYVYPARVAVVGGSHGGLLAGHLVGQHPTRFGAGVLRNPVMDVSLMVAVSDIPDWCWCEAWGAQEGKRRMKATPDAEDLAKMRAMSPIAHVDTVTAPLLFMLGAKDQRVPFVDAKRYVAALRAREGAPEATTFVFNEDTHALDRPQTEFEQWINVAAFLRRHLG